MFQLIFLKTNKSRFSRSRLMYHLCLISSLCIHVTLCLFAFSFFSVFLLCCVDVVTQHLKIKIHTEARMKVWHRALICGTLELGPNTETDTVPTHRCMYTHTHQYVDLITDTWSWLVSMLLLVFVLVLHAILIIERYLNTLLFYFIINGTLRSSLSE